MCQWSLPSGRRRGGRCEAESHDLPLGIAVPLGLIINELVTNAIKYAFRDSRAGRIHVSFKKRQEAMVLAIEDNGAGMQDKVQGTGMGLPLLNGLARSLGGKLELESGRTGTAACVTFPAPPRNWQDHNRGYLH